MRKALESSNWTTLEDLSRKHGAAAVNIPGQHGKTALHHASYNGKLQLIAVLLQQGADIHARSSQGATPLHAAARGNRAKVTALLASHGADVDAKDVQLATPLHEAAWRGHTAVVRALLDAGASPHPRNVLGYKPVDLVRNCTKEVKDMLLRAMEEVSDVESSISDAPLSGVINSSDTVYSSASSAMSPSDD